MLIQRAYRHLAGIVRLVTGWSRWQRFERKIYCCLTVDLDGHGARNAFAKGCPFLFDLFAANNLQGAITWFYNCNEKELTEQPFLLGEIKKRHDEVALHCHLENLPASTDTAEIHTRIRQGKAYVESLLDREIMGFRSGRFLRTSLILQAVGENGLTYDSSFTYGRQFTINGHRMDDREITGNQSAFRLPNGLLEFPVWEPFPEPGQISLTGPPYFITNLVHPFNFVWQGKANHPVQQYYKAIVEIFRQIPGIEFITLSQACHIWNQQSSKPS